MTDPIQVGEGRWVRFDRYELSGGYLQPAGGAALERYDPWETYRASRITRRGGEAPYESLLGLLTRIHARPGTALMPFALAPESQHEVVSWCEGHGLLGVLIHQVRTVVLAPRWSLLENDAWGRHGVFPNQTRYFREPTAWRGNTEWRVSADSSESRDASWVDRPLDPEEAKEAWAEPEVLIQNLEGGRVDREPLGATWCRFFPDVPKAGRTTYKYPLPRSEKFWRLYAEPIEEFLKAAVTLTDMLANLEHIKRLSDLPDENSARVARGLKVLQSLTEPVSPVLAPAADRTLEMRWVANSLIASFAMMALQDLSENRRVRRCAVCTRLFSSAAYQAQYCSRRCRNTAQKRRHRARN